VRDPCDIEAAAADLRHQAGLHSAEYVAAEEIVRALGGAIDPTAPDGCDGHMQLDPLRLRCRRDLPEPARSKALAHELGHLAAALAGWEVREDEADALGAALLVPRDLVNGLVRSVGYGVPAWMSAMPGLPVSMWLARLAEVRGAVAILRLSGKARRVFAGPGLEQVAPRSAPWETALVRLADAAPPRAARGESHHRDLFGVTAWVLGSQRSPWSVIVLSPEAIEVMGRGPDNDAPANGCDAMAWWHAQRVG